MFHLHLVETEDVDLVDAKGQLYTFVAVVVQAGKSWTPVHDIVIALIRGLFTKVRAELGAAPVTVRQSGTGDQPETNVAVEQKGPQ